MKNFRMSVYNKGKIEIGYEEMEAENLQSFLEALIAKGDADLGFKKFMNKGDSVAFYRINKYFKKKPAKKK